MSSVSNRLIRPGAVERRIPNGLSSRIKKAAGRNDTVSVNHRTAAFLASYFDVLFAINRVFHPGEKKQVAFALKNCRLLPMHFKEDFDELFKPGISFEEQINLLNRMFDELKDILQKD